MVHPISNNSMDNDLVNEVLKGFGKHDLILKLNGKLARSVATFLRGFENTQCSDDLKIKLRNRASKLEQSAAELESPRGKLIAAKRHLDFARKGLTIHTAEARLMFPHAKGSDLGRCLSAELSKREQQYQKALSEYEIAHEAYRASL